MELAEESAGVSANSLHNESQNHFWCCLHLEEPQSTVTLHRAYRLLLTAVVVAIKFIEDQCFVNVHYAKVGGVTLSDLNQMELTMCALLDFRFNMADDDASIILKQACPL